MKSGEQPHETASPAPAASARNDERRALLAPYLDALLSRASALAAGEELPDSISLEGAAVELNAWERRILSRHPAGTDHEGRIWPGLIAEAVAFRAKCAERAVSLDAEPGSGSPEQRAGLVEALGLDAAIGVALMQELQWTVEALIRANEFRIVKPVTEVRNALGVVLAEMRRRLGNEAFAAAEKLAPGLLDAHPMKTSPSTSEPEHDHVAPVQFKRDARAGGRIVSRKKAGPNRRMPVLLALLVLSSAGWVAFHLATRTDYVPPPILTIEQFRHIDAISAVMARPPSLFVDVDAPSWNRLREGQRHDLLDDIGSVAAGAGYLGVQARTTAGYPAGQWLKHGGSRLAAPSNGGT